MTVRIVLLLAVALVLPATVQADDAPGVHAPN
jgi:hypothetical protein